MSVIKAPAFQFYPKDYLADARVCELTMEEEGAYIRLLSHCWLEGSIPADPSRCARIVGKGCTNETATTVQRMFNEHPTDSARLVHKRLEEERAKQSLRREQTSVAGRRSGESRKKPTNPPVDGANDRSTDVQRKGNPPSPSASPSAVLHTHRAQIKIHPDEILIPENVNTPKCHELMNRLFAAMNERRAERGENSIDDFAIQANWDIAGQIGPDDLAAVIPRAIGNEWKTLIVPDNISSPKPSSGSRRARKDSDNIDCTPDEEILWAQIAAACKDTTPEGDRSRKAFDKLTKEIMTQIGGSAAIRELNLGEKPEREMKKRFILTRRQRMILEPETGSVSK